MSCSVELRVGYTPFGVTVHPDAGEAFRDTE